MPSQVDLGDPTLRLVLAHSIETNARSSLMVDRLSKSLERVKAAVRELAEKFGSDSSREEFRLLSWEGKARRFRAISNEALEAIERAAASALEDARKELVILEDAIKPAALVARALNSDGENSAKAIRRELRSAEVRRSLGLLDAGSREAALRRLVETESKERSFEALVVAADSPLEPLLEPKRLEGAVLAWYGKHEPGRVSTIEETASALGLCQAAYDRGLEYARAIASEPPRPGLRRERSSPFPGEPSAA